MAYLSAKYREPFHLNLRIGYRHATSAGDKRERFRFGNAQPPEHTSGQQSRAADAGTAVDSYGCTALELAKDLFDKRNNIGNGGRDAPIGDRKGHELDSRKTAQIFFFPEPEFTDFVSFEKRNH
jgi:hypothetical protein